MSSSLKFQVKFTPPLIRKQLTLLLSWDKDVDLQQMFQIFVPYYVVLHLWSLSENLGRDRSAATEIRLYQELMRRNGVKVQLLTYGDTFRIVSGKQSWEDWSSTSI